MIVDLGEARLEDREILARMLDDYLHELAAHRERAVGATNSRDYPYLDAYFSESGRHPFLIRQQGSVVGLALISQPCVDRCRLGDGRVLYRAGESPHRCRGSSACIHLAPVPGRLGIASPHSKYGRASVLAVLCQQVGKPGSGSGGSRSRGWTTVATSLEESGFR
jgi:hypothetical protein